VVDPVTDAFWTFNGYALARGTVFVEYPGEDGRWGTRWGAFTITGAPGDFNLDGFVNSTDVELFLPCVSGPEVPYAGVSGACTLVADLQGITPADFDRDGDVDIADWGVIQRCFRGPDPALEDCAQ
jgi:hypothetical protein